jgi:uncharacterized protein (TIGR02391 family)
MNLKTLLADPDTLLSLEPEESAAFLLQDLISQVHPSTRSGLNLHNLINDLSKTVHLRQREVMEAVSEAWQWLMREGLIARDPEQSADWVFVTRRGMRLKDRDAFRAYQQSGRLPRGSLHPLIADKVWPSFIHGDYDTAVFQAFREVEISVRGAAQLASTDLGVVLMRKAFGPGGPLADAAAPAGEQEALAHLFVGAIGSYKNPQSHRAVNLTNPVEAAEIIVFASHLLRVVDERKK